MYLLEKKIINKGRQIELDLAKGLAIFFMIAVHIQGELGKPDIAKTGIGGIVDFLGTIPAAPVFMFLLGTGIVFSRKSEAAILIKRGMHIVWLGYLLNIIRTTIVFLPLILFGGIGSYKNEFIISLVNIDILQFAGLAFIFFGIMKKINAKLLAIVTVTIIISLSNYILLKFQTNNYFFAAISGLFWGSNALSAFPFATWIFYPVAGFCFGEILIRQENKAVFYKRVFMIFGGFLFILILSGHVFSINSGLMSEVSYYHHTLFSNLLFTSFVPVWICILFYLEKFIPTLVQNVLRRWSLNVNSIYMIHWAIISIIGTITGFGKLNFLYFTATLCFVVIASDFIVIYLKRKGCPD